MTVATENSPCRYDATEHAPCGENCGKRSFEIRKPKSTMLIAHNHVLMRDNEIIDPCFLLLFIRDQYSALPTCIDAILITLETVISEKFQIN